MIPSFGMVTGSRSRIYCRDLLVFGLNPNKDQDRQN